jgi:hypothetical protein
MKIEPAPKGRTESSCPGGPTTQAAGLAYQAMKVLEAPQGRH